LYAIHSDFRNQAALLYSILKATRTREINKVSINPNRHLRSQGGGFGYQTQYLQFIYKGYIFIYNPIPISRKISK